MSFLSFDITYHFLFLDMIWKVLRYDVRIRKQDIADSLREGNRMKSWYIKNWDIDVQKEQIEKKVTLANLFM